MKNLIKELEELLIKYEECVGESKKAYYEKMIATSLPPIIKHLKSGAKLSEDVRKTFIHSDPERQQDILMDAVKAYDDSLKGKV